MTKRVVKSRTGEILIKGNNVYVNETLIVKSKYDASTPPSLTDDSSRDFYYGSIWVDVIGKQFYVCVDSSVGAAIWSSGGGGSSGGLDVWQQTVLDIINDPVVGVEGARYLIGTSPTGIWSSYPDHITEFKAGQWYYTDPVTGMHLPVLTKDVGVYVYGGTSWDYKKWELTTASGFLNKDINGDISLKNLSNKNIIIGNELNTATSFDTTSVSSDIEVSVSGISIKDNVIEDGMLVQDYIQTSEIDSTTLNWSGSDLSVKSTGIDHNATSGYVSEEHIRWDLNGVEQIDDSRIDSSSVVQHETSIHHDNLSGYVSEEHTRWDLNGVDQIDDSRISATSITQHESSINITNLSGYESNDFIDWTVSGVEKINDDRIISSSVTQHETSINHDNLSGFVSSEHISWGEAGVEVIDDSRIYSSSITQHESSINITNLSGYNPGEFTDWAISGIEQIDDSRIKVSSVTQHETSINHDNLSGFVSEEHIRWDLSGVEQIDDSRISSTSITQHQSDIDHNSLSGYVSNEHVNHSTIIISSELNGGLSGSGYLTGNISFKIDLENSVEKTSIDNDDKILIHDSIFDSLRSVKKNLISAKTNYEAISEPLPINDSSEGYTKGSVWLDNITNKLYTCVDDSIGSAIWTRGGGGSGSAAKLIKGGSWSWSLSSFELSFTNDSFIQFPGIQDARNTIQQSSEDPIVLSGSTDVAYVSINDDEGIDSNLSISVTGIQFIDEDVFIIARRVGDHVVVGSTLIKDGQIRELDTGMSWEDPVNSSLIPDTTEAYSLGSNNYKFKDLYVKDIYNESLTSETITATSIVGVSGNFDYITNSSLVSDTFSANSGSFNNITSENISATSLVSASGDFDYLESTLGEIDSIISNTLLSTSLISTSGVFDYLQSSNLMSDSITSTSLISSSGDFNYIDSDNIFSTFLISSYGQFDNILSENISATSLTSASGNFNYLKTDSLNLDENTSISLDASGNMLFVDNNWGPRTLYDLDSGFSNVKINKDVKVPGNNITTVTFDNLKFRYRDQGNSFYREGVLLTNKLELEDVWSTDPFIAIREYKENYEGFTWISSIKVNPNTPPTANTEFEAVIQVNTFDGAGLSEKYLYSAETLADGTGSLNCSTSSTATETFVNLNFDYILNISSNQIKGDLEIKVNGQKVSLRVNGYNDQYDGVLAEEVTSSQIKIYKWFVDTSMKEFLPDETLIQIVREEHFSSNLRAVYSHLIPGVSGTYDLGSPERPWREGYFTGNTVHIGAGAIRYNDTSKEIEIQNDITLADSWEPMNSVPVGAVIPWVGGYFTPGGDYTNVLGSNVSEANIYLNNRGWFVCDGSSVNDSKSPIFNGINRHLPDISDSRFMMGGTTVGGKGGANVLTDHTHAHALTAAGQDGGSHDHTYSLTAAGQGGGSHGHTYTLTAAGQSHTGNSPSVGTQSANHKHPVRAAQDVGVVSGNIGYGGTTVGTLYFASNGAYGGNSGDGKSYANDTNHNHTVSITHTHGSSSVSGTINSTAHTHDSSSVSGTINSTAHTHNSSSVSGTVGSGDVATSTENRPKYLSCLYIMKVR